MSRDKVEFNSEKLDVLAAMGNRQPWEAEDDWDEAQEVDDQARVEAGQVAEWKARRRIEAEVGRLQAVLASRPQSSGYSFDPDDERLTDLLAELEYLEVPPSDWQPEDSLPVATAHPVRPADPFTEALRAKLTPAQLVHWRWIEQGRKQAPIAKELGISQPAVAKRERQVRTSVDELYQEIYGKPYPWPGGVGRPRRLGARGPAR